MEHGRILAFRLFVTARSIICPVSVGTCHMTFHLLSCIQRDSALWSGSTENCAWYSKCVMNVALARSAIFASKHDAE